MTLSKVPFDGLTHQQGEKHKRHQILTAQAENTNNFPSSFLVGAHGNHPQKKLRNSKFIRT